MLPFPLIATRTRLTAVLVALLGAITLGGTVAAAPEPTVPSAELEVTARADCTTRADLIARVHARSPRVTFVEAGGALAIRARFSKLYSGAVAGDLTLARPGAAPSTRHIVAQTCAEVADAVALIIAVTLDPTAAEQLDRARAAPPTETAATESATPSKKNGPADDASRSPPAEPKEAPAPDSPGFALEPRETQNAARPIGRARFGALLAGQSFFGIAPGLMPGVALYLSAGIERAAPWSPAVVVGLSHSWRSTVDEPGGTASFVLDAVSLDACPARFRLSIVEAAPCASILGGRLAARGTNTQDSSSESARPFWALGASGVVSVPLVWRIEASARLALGANLVRDSFEFAPVVFHTVPPVSVAASVGVGLRSR